MSLFSSLSFFFSMINYRWKHLKLQQPTAEEMEDQWKSDGCLKMTEENKNRTHNSEQKLV